MLNNEIFVKGVITLNTAFPTTKLNMEKKTLEVWYSMLKDIENDDFQKAIIYLAQNSEFFPSIAAIRRKAMESACVEYSRTGEDAWGDVLRAVSSYGYMNEPRFEDVCTAKTINSLGWKQLCGSEETALPTIRAQFIRIYNSIKEREKEMLKFEQVDAGFAALIDNATKATALPAAQ